MRHSFATITIFLLALILFVSGPLSSFARHRHRTPHERHHARHHRMHARHSGTHERHVRIHDRHVARHHRHHRH